MTVIMVLLQINSFMALFGIARRIAERSVVMLQITVCFSQVLWCILVLLQLNCSIYHDRSGDGGDSYSPNIGSCAGAYPTKMYGLFFMNDNVPNSISIASGSRPTKNLNYHLPTNVDNEQLFTQLLLVGGPWSYIGSGIFLSDPDPVNQIAFTLGSPLTKQSLS